eukprot:6330280-Pyramimonas_sp.AAC.1
MHWFIPFLKHLSTSKFAKFAVLDQCQFGTDFRKRTGLDVDIGDVHADDDAIVDDDDGGGIADVGNADDDGDADGDDDDADDDD